MWHNGQGQKKMEQPTNKQTLPQTDKTRRQGWLPAVQAGRTPHPHHRDLELNSLRRLKCQAPAPQASLGLQSSSGTFFPPGHSPSALQTVQRARGGRRARPAEVPCGTGKSWRCQYLSPRSPASVPKGQAGPTAPAGAHHQLRAVYIP